MSSPSAFSSCPRCGFPNPGEVECARCGVILAKASQRSVSRPGQQPREGPPADTGGRRFTQVDFFLILILVGGIAWFVLGRFVDRETPAATQKPARRAAPFAPGTQQPRRAEETTSHSKANSQAILDAETVAAAERLAAEPVNPVRPGPPDAGPAVAKGGATDAYLVEIQGHVAGQRWREAEHTARRALGVDAADMRFHRVLVRALVMQNRDDDAADAIRRALAMGEDQGMRGLLATLEKRIVHERALAKVESFHFALQVQEGASHQGSRELLDFLERHYREMSRTLEYEPGTQIPVILFPGGEGLKDSGAPRWAAGTYNHFDGRIRIGSADLSYGMTPTVEQTLVHELAHAFIAGRTRTRIPREMNEGLAQYLSGLRPRPEVIDTRAFDPGATPGVRDYYHAALSFVDFLIRRYGQSSMNELLERFGEEAVDEAFRRVYGFGYAEARQAWVKQLP
jgi:hypothetical protein